jgi:hypothetical protein
MIMVLLFPTTANVCCTNRITLHLVNVLCNPQKEQAYHHHHHHHHCRRRHVHEGLGVFTVR